MFGFLDLIPKAVYALAVAGLVALLGVTSWQLRDWKAQYNKEHTAFVTYQNEANKNAAAAQAKVRDVEAAAAENERKTRDEQERLQAASAAERASLERTIAGLRQQQSRFSAGIAANAKSGDVAALAARAAAADKLLGVCTARYTELGKRAEKVRLQALGLYQYIQGNQSCSQSFGTAAPDPG